MPSEPRPTAARPDLLEAIVAAARRIVASRRRRLAADDLARRAASRTPRGDLFRRRLSTPGKVNLIAECKRRSPSSGVLRAEYDPVDLARQYVAGGAAAVSVLTEPTFFDGSLEHLAAVRAAVRVPLLRKDFIVDEYQLLEARLAGADATLLIVAALDERTLRALLAAARDLGLACVVEAHDELEMDRAIDAGADIIGVNNRDLSTLRTDRAVSRRLAARMPESVVAVAESGMRSPDDLARARAAGYHACLVGEGVVTAADPAEAVRRLTTAERGASA